MWKLFFVICDLLCGLIPSRKKRDYIRQVRLYDWKRKYNALHALYPDIKFRNVKIIKGGWNIGFIVDNKYVCKIRKFNDVTDLEEKIIRQKRITDALAPISPLRIPTIEILHSDGYTFYKYDFIPGKNLNTYSARTIEKYSWLWTKQLGEFIYKIHNARPAEIDDLRTLEGDGWNHNDICNNIIVDNKTKQIIGLIDWEYVGWGKLDTEIANCSIFSKKMRNLHLELGVQLAYLALENENKKVVKKPTRRVTTTRKKTIKKKKA